MTRKRVLIVNCYFDHDRTRVARPLKVPQAMAPVYLAGALSRELCDVKVHSELASGPLEDPKSFAWADMLVLTGLTNSFDRFLHLTAYARTVNPQVIVVAGGPPVRALPKLAQRYFDYACLGDVEELRDVVRDGFGPSYVAEQMVPRYDLAPGRLPLGYLESTRYCNFACDFCSLTAEKRAYRNHGGDEIRRQMYALGRHGTVLFLDNNFYGNDRTRFFARLDTIRELHEEGCFKRWGALVTSDFFSKPENLWRARESGCAQLFTGLESFDPKWLASVNKNQNNTASPIRTIVDTLEAGILYAYPLLLDVYNRTLAELRAELEFVTGTPEITLPAFVGIPIPILGTPLFRSMARAGRLLPSVKLRDMDSTNLVSNPRDPLHEVTDFLRDLASFRSYRRRIVRHSLGFARRYAGVLPPFPLTVALGNAAMLCAEGLVTGSLASKGRAVRTHVSTTEALDPTYTPAFRIDPRYARHFDPTMVTDPGGELTDAVLEAA